MTARSPYVGRRLFSAADLFDAESALGAASVRDTVFNNALHAADMCGGHLVSWVALDTSLISGNPRTYMTPTDTGARSNRWCSIGAFGPFSIPHYASGRPYLLRLRVLGAASTGSASCSFGFTIGDIASVTELDETFFDDAPALHTDTTTSTTPIVLTTYDATAAPTDLIRLSDVSSIYTSRSTLDDTSGRSVTVDIAEFVIRCWGKSTAVLSALPRLYGLHVGVFVGPL